VGWGPVQVEISSLSRSKLGIEMAWALEKERVFPDFRAETGRLTNLVQE
jgi:hypothetical protein